MRRDVIDQLLAMALHPAYDIHTAKVSMDMMLNLTQSPETHTYIIRREVVERMLEICELKQKKHGKKADHIVINTLKYVTIPFIS